MTDQLISYIIDFIAGEYASLITYADDNKNTCTAKIIIKPSGFFDSTCYGKKNSIPTLPLQQIEGIPVLFGQGKIERKSGTVVIYADLVASSYYLLSRYEELVKRETRDLHGRFPGKLSLPYLGGFIDRPIIDEYREFIYDILRSLNIHVKETPQTFSRIYLTHDVDQPWPVYNFSNAVRTSCMKLLRNRELNLWPILNYLGIYHKNFLESFQFMIDKDNSVRRIYGECCQPIYFILAVSQAQNLTRDYLKDPKINKIISLLTRYSCDIGLHTSYDAGYSLLLAKKEKKLLESKTGKAIIKNRYHFLRSMEPEDMEALIESGISEDFSMGYADVSGFRLGTCRAVKYINPATKKVTDLLLHPLNIMEGTLSDQRYMDLELNGAIEYSKKIIDQVKKYHGDLTLLWHNNSCEKDVYGYHRELYGLIMDYVSNLMEKEDINGPYKFKTDKERI